MRDFSLAEKDERVRQKQRKMCPDTQHKRIEEKYEYRKV